MGLLPSFFFFFLGLGCYLLTIFSWACSPLFVWGIHFFYVGFGLFLTHFPYLGLKTKSFFHLLFTLSIPDTHYRSPSLFWRFPLPSFSFSGDLGLPSDLSPFCSSSLDLVLLPLPSIRAVMGRIPIGLCRRHLCGLSVLSLKLWHRAFIYASLPVDSQVGVLFVLSNFLGCCCLFLFSSLVLCCVLVSSFWGFAMSDTPCLCESMILVSNH